MDYQEITLTDVADRLVGIECQSPGLLQGNPGLLSRVIDSM
jgi:hypothetical protein